MKAWRLSLSKPLIFLGSNGAITSFADAAARQGIVVAGIFDKDYYGNTSHIKKVPVIGTEEDLLDPIKCQELKSKYDFFVATNWNPFFERDIEKRKYLIALVETAGIECINLIDPSTYIESDVQLGHGIYIGYGSVIGFESTIEDFVQIHYHSALGHNTRIGKNTVIQRRCGVAGNIGKNVYIGQVTQLHSSKPITVGDNAIIDQGLFLSRSVETGERVSLSKDAIRTYRTLCDADI